MWSVKSFRNDDFIERRREWFIFSFRIKDMLKVMKECRKEKKASLLFPCLSTPQN